MQISRAEVSPTASPARRSPVPHAPLAGAHANELSGDVIAVHDRRTYAGVDDLMLPEFDASELALMQRLAGSPTGRSADWSTASPPIHVYLPEFNFSASESNDRGIMPSHSAEHNKSFGDHTDADLAAWEEFFQAGARPVANRKYFLNGKNVHGAILLRWRAGDSAALAPSEYQPYGRSNFVAWAKHFEQHGMPDAEKSYEFKGQAVDGAVLRSGYDTWLSHGKPAPRMFASIEKRKLAGGDGHIPFRPYFYDDYVAWVHSFQTNGKPKQTGWYDLNGKRIPGQTLFAAYQRWNDAGNPPPDVFARNSVSQSKKRVLPATTIATHAIKRKQPEAPSGGTASDDYGFDALPADLLNLDLPEFDASDFETMRRLAEAS